MSLVSGRWYPVAAADDMPHGHVYRTILGAHALASWRGPGGEINIGETLRCAYHAWQFASGSGACRFIPAQPASKPAAAIRAVVWPVAEAGGLIWTGQDPQGLPPALGTGEVLRAMPLRRGANYVAEHLASMPGVTLVVQPQGADSCTIRGLATGLPLGEADKALEALRRRLEGAPC